MRRSSGSDVPGLVIQCIKKSRSLNTGNKDSPSRGTTPKPRMARRPTVMRWRMTRSTGSAPQRSIWRNSGPLMRNLRTVSLAHAGVKVVGRSSAR